jgi:Trk K+ transport system NAD-binding subunit
VDEVQGGRTVEVLGGMHLGEIPVAKEWIGKTIRELDMRQILGLEVVVVHRTNGTADGAPEDLGLFPSGDLVLERGDRLLVVGHADAISRLTR